MAKPPDGLSFGERLANTIRDRAARSGFVQAARVDSSTGEGGVVVLGSGSIPLARAADLRRFVEIAAGPGGHALANNRFSADVVAVSTARDLAGLPPLPADNALPRWLEERAGVAVADLRARWRLGVDVDTPLDLIVLGGPAGRRFHGTAPLVGERLAALSDVLRNWRAELLVAGRVSAATLRWLESGVACRVRALVEERGLRAAGLLAQSGATTGSRPPRSILGELLDRDGPEALAATVARLADAAVIDTRVLIAHRNGADESTWPGAEDNSPRICCWRSPSPIRGCAPSRNWLRARSLPLPGSRSSSAATPSRTAGCACSRSELGRGNDDDRTPASVGGAPASNRSPAAGRSFAGRSFAGRPLRGACRPHTDRDRPISGAAHHLRPLHGTGAL